VTATQEVIDKLQKQDSAQTAQKSSK
jgi:hypothetical protein